MAEQQNALTDHEEIKRWASIRNAQPSKVDTESEEGEGILRFDLPDDGKDEGLTPISWEEFFQIFEDRQLALLWDESSNFNKFVRREGTE